NQLSWTSQSSYDNSYESLVTEGKVQWDTNTSSLILFHSDPNNPLMGYTLVPGDPNIHAVSGAVMPLNSKPQNFHCYFDEPQTGAITIADPSVEVVEILKLNVSNTVCIYCDGKPR